MTKYVYEGTTLVTFMCKLVWIWLSEKADGYNIEQSVVRASGN